MDDAQRQPQPHHGCGKANLKRFQNCAFGRASLHVSARIVHGHSVGVVVSHSTHSVVLRDAFVEDEAAKVAKDCR